MKKNLETWEVVVMRQDPTVEIICPKCGAVLMSWLNGELTLNNMEDHLYGCPEEE